MVYIGESYAIGGRFVVTVLGSYVPYYGYDCAAALCGTLYTSLKTLHTEVAFSCLRVSNQVIHVGSCTSVSHQCLPRLQELRHCM